MTERDVLDNLIRSTVRDEVAGLEPSPAVRDTLMAAAAQRPATLSVGPMIPPLASGLREPAHLPGVPGWREKGRDQVAAFGSAQQGLVSLWLLTMQTRY
ncbi:MAG TPA: hypothetical protein VFF59_06315 [Anaerolineae bacterium]|nr:hypothetical protein [Anaerolineae bacterium]